MVFLGALYQSPQSHLGGGFISHNGTYEPLISKRLFDDLQTVLKNKAKPKKINYESEAKQRAQVVESRQRQYQRIQSELDGYFKMRARDKWPAHLVGTCC